MAGLKPGSAEYNYTIKMIEGLEKDFERYKKEKNHEWIWRTEVRLQYYRNKLTNKQ